MMGKERERENNVDEKRAITDKMIEKVGGPLGC